MFFIVKMQFKKKLDKKSIQVNFSNAFDFSFVTAFIIEVLNLTIEESIKEISSVPQKDYKY